MKKHLILFTIGLLTALPSMAQRGRERRPEPPMNHICQLGRGAYEVNLNERYFFSNQREPGVLAIKQELTKAYPRLRLANADLIEVCVEAKSRHGRGSADLMIGHSKRDVANIPGEPRGFDISRDRTYSAVYLKSYDYSDDRGAWQLHISGEVKVNRLVVSLRERRPPPPVRLQHVDYQFGKVDKFIRDVKMFHVNLDGVRELTLVGNVSTVDVTDIEIVLRGGRRYTGSIQALLGNLRDGQEKTLLLDGERIQSITVTATSISLGSRAEPVLRLGYRL